MADIAEAAMARFDGSEAGFERSIIELAESTGWRAYSIMDSKRAKLACRTAVGFPDIVLARPGQLRMAECKIGGRQPTDEQREWLRILGAGPATAHLWTPADWPAIERAIVRRR